MDRRATLALSLCSGLSLAERRLLSELFPSGEELMRLDAEQIEGLLGRRLGAGWQAPREYAGRSEGLLRYLERSEIKLLVYGEADYPPALRELYAPPYLLYLRGRLSGTVPEWVAVVGTRHPTESGRSGAYRLGAELALSGLGLVSGLAYGIDGAAHWGAVRYGGASLAVLAHGVDSVYPAGHRELAGEILRHGGGLLSEYPPGTQPRRYHFPERNRLISGLCRGTVIVQAPEKSGALITADYALEQGRDVWVHRSGSEGPRGGGTRRLREEGAPTLEHGDELLRAWGFPRDGAEVLELDARRFPAERMMEEELSGRVTRFAGRLYRRAV